MNNLISTWQQGDDPQYNEKQHTAEMKGVAQGIIRIGTWSILGALIIAGAVWAYTA